MITIFPQRYEPIEPKEKEYLMSILFSIGTEHDRIFQISENQKYQRFYRTFQKIRSYEQRIVIFTDTVLVQSIPRIARQMQEAGIQPNLFMIYDDQTNPLFRSRALPYFGKLFHNPPAIDIWLSGNIKFLLINSHVDKNKAEETISTKLKRFT